MWLLKLKLYAGIALSVIVAIGSAVLYGRREGKQAQKREAIVEAAEVKNEAAKTQRTVDEQVAKNGAGGSDRVLRDDWMRDE